jgi:hypothetical protein
LREKFLVSHTVMLFAFEDIFARSLSSGENARLK